MGVVLPERHLRYIRSRCKNLQIEHPDIPEDPDAWIGVMKRARSEGRDASKRVLRSLKGGMF